MKATIWSNGDPSVGINGNQAEVDMPYLGEVDDEYRQGIRESLIMAFSDIFDDKAFVTFDDECPDCLKKDTEHSPVCPSKNDPNERD